MELTHVWMPNFGSTHFIIEKSRAVIRINPAIDCTRSLFICITALLSKYSV